LGEEYEYEVSEEALNKIFWDVFDKYGYENCPYEYSKKGYAGKTTCLEIRCCRYSIKYIKDLLKKFGIKFSGTKDDIIFIKLKD